MSKFVPAARLRGLNKSQIRQVFDRALPGSINLGLGEPDLITPEVIREAAVRVIKEEQNGYTNQAGLQLLREKIAADYPQLSLTPDHVIITAGSQEALYLALMTLVDEGDEVLIPNPGFVAYPTIVRMAGGSPKFYRLPAAEGFSFDLEAFQRALSPRTKVVVCISPSNPTGRILSTADLKGIADTLQNSNTFVISDEIYRELYYTPVRPPSISEFYERTILLSGLSKSMSMTGWRLGWICGEAAVIRSALVLHGYVTTCASTISQKAALAAWTVEAEKSRAEIRSIFRRRRDHLINMIGHKLNLTATTPEGAFYTMMDVSHCGDSMELVEAMLEQRVITIPGSAFGSEGEGYLRVSFCADLPQLTEGVERMEAAIKTAAIAH